MLEDEFLKERQNIRQKMLKFSRAVSQGKPLDKDLKEDFSSDDILRRRFKKKTAFLEELDEEYEPKSTKQSNIYLKEDLINVKLEEKQSLAKKIFSKMKTKNKEKKKESHKKTRKIFSFARKKSNEAKNTPNKAQIQNNQIPTQAQEEKPTKPSNQTQKPKIQQAQSTEKKIEKKPEPKNQPDVKQSLENLQKKIKQENKQELPKPPVQVQKQQNNEDAQKEKNVLLEGFSNATKEDRNLNFNHLLFAALLVSFALFLFAPQIYIRNQIYYLSREIATLRTEENVLNEENKDLKRRLENMRFQNQILDYLE